MQVEIQKKKNKQILRKRTIDMFNKSTDYYFFASTDNDDNRMTLIKIIEK